MVVREINIGIRRLTDVQERPHNDLDNRDYPDCHPISSVSSLNSQLTNAGIIHTSYYIYNNAGIIYAKNGLTGIIEKSDPDFYTVIQYTIGKLTSGGKIVIGDGTFTVNIGIIANNPNILIQGFGNGRTILIAKNSLNSDIITVTASKVSLRDFMIDGNRTNQTSGRGIAVISGTILVMDSVFEDLEIKNCKSHGLYLDSTVINLRLFRILSQTNDGNGFDINGSDHYCKSCEARTNSGFAWNLTGASHSLVACAGSGSALSGYLAGSFRTDFIGCFADTNFGHGMYLSGDLCNVIGGHYYLNNRNNSFYAGITVVGKNCKICDTRIGEAPSGIYTQTHQYNLFVQSSATNAIISNNTLIKEGASLGNLLDEGIQTIFNKNYGYSSATEIVGIKSPVTIYPLDIGLNWKDLGVIYGAIVLSITPFGNGIAIFTTDDSHVLRTTDYGKTWNDIGAISTYYLWTSCYFGNGIGIISGGFPAGVDIYRTTDYGMTWSTVFTYSYVEPRSLSSKYLGNGIAILGEENGNIIRTTDYGANWGTINISIGSPIRAIEYLGNGIVILGDAAGNIFRCTDYGATTTSFTKVATIGSNVMSLSYLGNGITIGSTEGGSIYRSIDFGLTWSFIITISGEAIRSTESLGNGIAVAVATNRHIYISRDYGASWSDLGSILSAILYKNNTAYLGNGVTITGDNLGHIFRSEIAYKLDESQVNFPRKPINVTASRTFGITYTNSDKNRTLMVLVGASLTTTGAGQSGYLRIKSDSNNPPTTVVSPKTGNEYSAAPEIYDVMTFAFIEPGLNYLVETILGAGVSSTKNLWFEIYI